MEYDFTQTVFTPQLLDEIATAGLPTPDRIDTTGTAVQVFYSTPLTNDQTTTLSSVVGDHVANTNYVTVLAQGDINRLVAYLNNSNSTIANTARAVMVNNLAPRLPDGLIQTINSQIQAIVGS